MRRKWKWLISLLMVLFTLLYAVTGNAAECPIQFDEIKLGVQLSTAYKLAYTKAGWNVIEYDTPIYVWSEDMVDLVISQIDKILEVPVNGQKLRIDTELGDQYATTKTQKAIGEKEFWQTVWCKEHCCFKKAAGELDVIRENEVLTEYWLDSEYCPTRQELARAVAQECNEKGKWQFGVLVCDCPLSSTKKGQLGVPGGGSDTGSTPETNTATPVPEITPKPTPVPEVTPKPTPVPEVTPKPTPVPEVTPKPTPVPEITPKPTPNPGTPTSEPTKVPIGETPNPGATDSGGSGTDIGEVGATPNPNAGNSGGIGDSANKPDLGEVLTPAPDAGGSGGIGESANKPDLDEVLTPAPDVGGSDNIGESANKPDKSEVLTSNLNVGDYTGIGVSADLPVKNEVTISDSDTGGSTVIEVSVDMPVKNEVVVSDPEAEESADIGVNREKPPL